MHSPFTPSKSYLHFARKRRKIDGRDPVPFLDFEYCAVDSQDYSADLMDLVALDPIAQAPINLETSILESFSNEPNPPFFRIPIEVRLRIYYYAFQHPDGDLDPAWLSPFQRPVIQVLPPDARWKKDSKPAMGTVFWGTELMTGLLRVNRQIYSEAIGVLYSEFVFDFKPMLPRSASVFLRTITPDAAAMVRTVYFTIFIGTPASEIAPYLWMCSNPYVNTGINGLCKGIINKLPKLRCVYLLVRFWDMEAAEEKMTQDKMEEAIMDVLAIFSCIEQVHLRPSHHYLSKSELATIACHRRHAEFQASTSSLFREVFDIDKLTREGYQHPAPAI